MKTWKCRTFGIISNMTDDDSYQELLAKLHAEYPLTIHTGAGRIYTTVRRMKAEKEWGIPIHLRSGFAISVNSGKAANNMAQEEWEKFFQALCDELHRVYPELYRGLFPESKTG